MISTNNPCFYSIVSNRFLHKHQFGKYYTAFHLIVANHFLNIFCVMIDIDIFICYHNCRKLGKVTMIVSCGYRETDVTLT